MGGISKAVGKITDMAGLTDIAGAEAEQKRYEEEQARMQAQAMLENDQSGENISNVNAGGAASASATEITGAQKARRKASMSNALGI